ncbi:ABZJ_00895 family protein [Psychrobacter alimentarius]|uniref:ABZJ_00895 family protein n=1 Tax=Psychrobacter alimentarius TaxID=261164 RepID=UPI003FD4FF1D
MSRKTPTLNDSTSHLGNNRSLNAHQLPRPKLARYIGFFAIGYVLSSAVFMMIQTKVALNSPLVTVISIIVGAYIAVHKFIKQQQRALNRGESNRLVFGGIAVVWVLTVIYFLGIWFWLFDAASREVLFEMTTQQPLPLLFSLMLILVMTLVSARISIWLLNRLLDPKRKTV